MISASDIKPCGQLLSGSRRCQSKRVRLERGPKGRKYVCRDCGAERPPEDLQGGQDPEPKE